MPFTKAKNYKRFNVGECMQKKLDSWEIEQKSKKAKNTAQKLKRMDTKVRALYIFLFLEIDSYGFDFIAFSMQSLL